ncbi:hypothetical protein KEM55_004917 [Ascosphaera atra]|nr:hypothetical protein KEM55_004917 [Ascosphaera atra]
MAAAVDNQYAPSFGAQLKDSFKPVNAWVSLGIEWLDELQSFYRERSAIEKEYSQKMVQLCRRYHERKAKKSSTLSVGDTPTMTPGSLEAASLTTWTTQLQAIETEAQDRDKYASELISQVADPIKLHSMRFEELRRAHAEYAAKLEKERDASYSDLRKTKGRYDSICQEVESRRKKAESSSDKSKAQAAFQQQIEEMNNMKNTYLIAINVTNKLKERYYNEYVPEVLDSLQELNEIRVSSVNESWLTAMNLEKAVLQKQTDQVMHVMSEIPRNDPKLDSMLFAQHNVPTWSEPPDIPFEPSPIWHDDATMVTDDNAKVYLMNVLSKSKSSVNDMKAEADRKRNEVEDQKRLRHEVRAGKNKGSEIQVVHNLFSKQEELHDVDRKLLTSAVEIAIITTTVGDITVGAQRHNFRPQTFKIPTNCDLCGERIWGLSAKGSDCKDCGFTCHNKCEMKVPADCPGEMNKEEKKKLKAMRQESAANRNVSTGTTGSSVDISASANGSTDNVNHTLRRQDTMASLSSQMSASSASGGLGRSMTGMSGNTMDNVVAGSMRRGSTNRALQPPTSQFAKSGESPFNAPTGRVLYAFTANDPDECSVGAGEEITVIEPDDDSGWTRVRAGNKTGLVPTSYIEIHKINRSATPEAARPGSNRSNASSASLANSLSTALASSVGGKRRGPAVAPRRGAKKLQYVVALYDYAARTDAEFSFEEGDKFVLVNRDSGNGWSDVEKDGVVKSVPANYVDLC